MKCVSLSSVDHFDGGLAGLSVAFNTIISSMTRLGIIFGIEGVVAGHRRSSVLLQRTVLMVVAERTFHTETQS
jgi:hypothetical protein